MSRLKLRDWRAKAALQQVFSHVPAGHRANYLFQRHVTHGLPHSDAELAGMLELGEHHIAVLERYASRPIGEATFFEFGAGWDFMMAFILSALGAGPQIVIDLRRLARLDLALDAEARVSELVDVGSVPPSPGGVGLPTLDALLGAHDIDYRAPADARSTGFDAGSIDCVTSTNTLEHIPPADIRLILAECHRILADDGVMSFQIDYQDHYSYFDPRVSVYNFLRYTDREWRWYNPSLHQQNRLRHQDYWAWSGTLASSSSKRGAHR